MKTHALNGLLVLLSLLACAQAYDRPGVETNFAKLDTDSSDHVTTPEVLAHLDRQFLEEVELWIKFYDSDGDGKVQKDEYFALPKSNEEYWEGADLDKDGFVTREEMRSSRDSSHPDRAETFIKYYDADKNGHISPAEFAARHADL